MAAMLRSLAHGLLFCSLIFGVIRTALADEYTNCNCDDDGFWTIQTILECQRVSDFLIAIAYFSIPIELLYFLSRANLPFKWVVFQFIAFIVLCGLTHLLNAWTYYGPHSFQLMLSLTAAKLLTALVSCATAITLLTLIPLLLKVKVREVFLTQNVLELGQEVGMMKRQKEASWHVRMLTQEIRKSLDKHTILDTTLVELSKTLDLQNCAVWMPNEYRTEMNLTHELKRRNSLKNDHLAIPIYDMDIQEINKSKGVRLLRPDSALGSASSGEYGESGAVAAIRMPMLSVSNFKGGTPELREACYAILVLVLPCLNPQEWSPEELEIVEVVADQVAVALSHAAVLEESQLMREQLAEQNLALQQAKKNALMASQARNSFQKVMSHGMRRPMHSVLGLLSIFQDDSLSNEQKIIIDTMIKTSSVLSTLINDVMEISEKDTGRFPFEMRPFRLHSMVKEASCLAKCMCVYKGFLFQVHSQNSLPDHVIGDEKRTFQVILHMVGYLLNMYDGAGSVTFRVLSDSESDSINSTVTNYGVWKPSTQGDHACIKFEIEMNDGVDLAMNFAGRRQNNTEITEGLSFSMCKKLVQMMQGNIWISPSSRGGIGQSMILLLRLQIQPSFGKATFAVGNSSEQLDPNSQLKGLRVILADDDNVNRTVTRKLLEKLGCQVTTASSGFECLSALSHTNNAYRIVLLDLHMPEIDGFEVALRIQKFRSRKRPLIVALTASAEDNVWERCLHAGMDGLIRKPILLQGMADELRRVLQRENEGV